MPGRFLLRASLAATAVALAAAGVEAWQLGSSQSSPSILLRATPILAIVGALLSALGAFLPARTIDRWLAKLCKATPHSGSWAPVKNDNPNRVAIYLLSLGVFIAIAAFKLWRPTDPHDDDQQAFVELATDIQMNGGWMYLWSQMQSGAYPEANRHPLYPVLLSTHPDVRYGRALSLGFSVLALGLCGWLVTRRFPPASAAIFMLLLAVNRSFAGYATAVVCESLMILLGGLIYFALLPPRSTAGPPRMVLRSILAAAYLGLMYLTKATGLLYFAVFMLWLAWQSWPRRSADEPTSSRSAEPFLPPGEPWQLRRLVIVLLCSLAAFLAVAHPLIIRNVRRFGNPFHNDNSLLLFADRFEQFEQMLAARTTTAQARDQYLATHSAADMLRREASGLAWEAFIMLRALGPIGLDDARVLFGVPIALCCLFSLITDGRPATSLLAAWIFTSWVVFAWYVPIAAGDRFPIPLLVPVLAHAADGFSRIVTLRRPATPISQEIAI